MKKIKPYTPRWEGMANRIARARVRIKPCKKCGYPVVDGFCCGRCGTDEPEVE